MYTRILSKKNLFPLYAAVLTAILYLVILGFSHILGYGNLTILTGDLFTQYTAFIQLFLETLKGNGNFWYSFSLYLGSPTVAVYAYYCLSPFNLLYLIPGISVSAMTIVLICLKLSAAAAAFEYYSQKALKADHLFSVLLSCAYSLCTFAVTMQIHIMWLDALYILPILILFLMKAAQGHRFLPLVPIYSLLFITNFYMGYIVGVFSSILFLAFLVYYMPDRSKASFKTLFQKIAFLGLSVILAAGCCTILLLPTAVNLIAARSSDGSAFQMVSATVPDVLNNLFLGEMQGMGSPFPLIYCGLPMLLLLPVYYASGHITKKEKVLTLCLLFLYLCGSLYMPVYKFFHAFEAPNWYAHRYAFCIVFLLLSMGIRAYSVLPAISPKKAAAYLSAILLFYALMIPFQTLRFSGRYAVNTHEWWIVNAVFLVSYVLLYLSSGSEKAHPYAKPAITILFLGELVVNGCYCISHNNFGFFEEKYVNEWIAKESGPLDAIKSADPDFYRIRVEEEDSFNAPSYFHYAGLNSFSTTDAPKLRELLSSLGLGTSFMTIYDHGHTRLTDMLLGVKYTISDAQQTIFASSTALPVAFMVSPSFASWSPSSDVFFNQENSLNLMTDGNYSFFTPISLSDADIVKKNMEILPFDTGYGFQHESDIAANGIITFRFPNHKGETILAYFSTFNPPTIDETSPEALSTTSGFFKQYNLSDGTIITSILDPETDIPEIEVSFYAGMNYDYFVNNISFYSYSDADLSAVYKDLSAQQIQMLKWSDGDMTFSVTATEARPILYTSIPYDKGWEAYVDGVPTKIGVTMNGTFLALVLTPGEHTVQLVYEQPCQFPATCVSAISILIVLLIYLRQNRKDSSDKVTAADDKEA